MVNYKIMKTKNSNTVKPADIIGDYGYGIYENDCLTPIEDMPYDNEEFIIFDYDRIGRGITVTPDSDGYSLMLHTVNCEEETDLFFDIIERICGLFGSFKIIEEHETEIALEDIPEKRAYYKEANRGFVSSFTDTEALSKLFENNNCVKLYSARFPLEMNKEIADRIHNAPDPVKALGDWLHECQNVDHMYIFPRFIKTADGGYAGVYIIPEDTESIVPLKPSVPAEFDDDNGQPFEPERWIAALFQPLNNRIAKAVLYDKFISMIKDKTHPFDGNKVVVNGIDEKTAEEIFTGYFNDVLNGG